MAGLLFNIGQVFGDYVSGDLKYNIPEYQRGYKWSSQQINQLLDDINGFEDKGDEQLFYCLQNITLIGNTKHERSINVVDGQQRLTTISLLLAYLGEGERVKGKIVYSVREPSDKFLQSIVSDSGVRDQVLQSENFEAFTSKEENADYDFQDIFFMYNAFRAFDSWFKKNEGVSSERFCEKLLGQVKLIVNRVDGISEQELFVNLNAGQVHLDGSDLVRAILITRVAKQEMEEYDPSNMEDVIRLNERRLRIGWELDELNNWWSQPTVREYFANYSSIKTAPNETVRFNENEYPINLLYKIWAESNGKTEVKLAWFETKHINALELYTSIIQTHRILQDWYNDRFIYHLGGFLFKNYKPKFQTFWSKWVQEKQTRDDFRAFLKDLVEKAVFGTDSEENEPDQGIDVWLHRILDFDSGTPTNWYETGILDKVLILLDVIAHCKETDSGNPLPFMMPKYLAIHMEDKEHIYPGTPKQLDVLKEIEQPVTTINQYIEELNKGYEDEALIGVWDLSDEEWSVLEADEQEQRRKRLKHEIHQKRPINSIGNLVMLHRSINRSFGNDYYPEKRKMVVKNAQNGEYIRQHTLNVFVKNVETEDLNEWTMEDIQSNARHIRNALVDFFEVELENREDETE